jgi:hypothetical protein
MSYILQKIVGEPPKKYKREDLHVTDESVNFRNFLKSKSGLEDAIPFFFYLYRRRVYLGFAKRESFAVLPFCGSACYHRQNGGAKLLGP